MALILLIGFGVVLATINSSGGLEVVVSGLFGKTGTYTDLFSGDGLNVFYTFGIPVTIGLLSGPFGDQSFWQRAFAIKRKSVQPAFILAAFIFGVVPLTLSVLGFVAAGAGMDIKNTSQVNMEVVTAFLPTWVIVPFVFLLLSGLVSTLDSNLSAIASIAGHDLLERKKTATNKSDILKYSKGSMVILVVGGIAIANIPGLTILYLFLFYGTLRASTLLPTIITLLKKDVSEAGVFWGVIISLTIGLPIFAYGNLHKIVPMIVGGSLFTVLASGITVFAVNKINKK
jgi:Na+/proline symporter